MTLTLNAEQRRVDFDDPNRQQDVVAARASLRYALNSNLSVDASVGYRQLDDSVFPNERVTDSILRVRWTLRMLEVNPMLQLFRRERGGTDVDEFQFLLRIIRRF
jgi:hypothetical protein